jgi:hypothetical protein
MWIDNCTQVNSSLQFISFTDYENHHTQQLEEGDWNLLVTTDLWELRLLVNIINFTLQIRIASSRIFSYVIIAIWPSNSFKSKSFNFSYKFLCCNIPQLHSVNVSQNADGNSISRTSYYEQNSAAHYFHKEVQFGLRMASLYEDITVVMGSEQSDTARWFASIVS